MSSKIETLLKVLADFEYFENSLTNATSDMLTDSELDHIAAAAQTPESVKKTTAE